ncbi:MAG: DUF4445 domain-containing protein [Caldisericaceae bacterium]|nr:DUF4445 domain-containing protein [Caldisericaceae bacterium]
MPNPHKTILLTIRPDDVNLIVQKNLTLSEALLSAGINLQLPCGGAGVCGKCKVKFLNGAQPPNLQEETLLSPQECQQGFRLACITRVTDDCEIFLPDELRLSPQVAHDRLTHKMVEFDPPVKKIHFKITLKELENARSDLELIFRYLNTIESNQQFFMADHVLPKIPHTLRAQQGELTLTLFEDQIIDFEPGDTRSSCFGLAIDLGTTTIGVLLLDLTAGTTLDYAVFPNPQSPFGSDLISRISFASQGSENALKLMNIVRQALAEVIEQLCIQHQISPSNIYLTVIAGNTVMIHLFWGVSPQYVGVFPFKPVFSSMLKQFNLFLDRGKLNLPMVISFPLIGGFVGGDIVSDMLAAELTNGQENVLLIDIGTNCEVVLKHDGQLFATSAPAGPALEGANISQGMRAIPGALIDLKRQGESIVFKTIDDEPARGICGSGLFHIIHFLREQQVISEDGRIVEQHADTFWNNRLLIGNAQQTKILLVSKAEGAIADIFLTQQDIRNFQLANGAISSAWCLLLKQRQMTPEQIDKIIIAGAFGNYIRAASMMALGTIPAIDEDRVQFIGNGSLEGVREFLLNKKLRKVTQELASRSELVELASDPQFQEVFVEHLKLTKRRI